MRISRFVLLAFLTVAPMSVPSRSTAAAAASDAAPPGTSPDPDPLSTTIRSLEAMGNRFTRDKQWEAARWISVA